MILPAKKILAEVDAIRAKWTEQRTAAEDARDAAIAAILTAKDNLFSGDPAAAGRDFDLAFFRYEMALDVSISAKTTLQHSIEDGEKILRDIKKGLELDPPRTIEELQERFFLLENAAEAYMQLAKITGEQIATHNRNMIALIKRTETPKGN